MRKILLAIVIVAFATPALAQSYHCDSYRDGNGNTHTECRNNNDLY